LGSDWRWIYSINTKAAPVKLQPYGSPLLYRKNKISSRQIGHKLLISLRPDYWMSNAKACLSARMNRQASLSLSEAFQKKGGRNAQDCLRWTYCRSPRFDSCFRSTRALFIPVDRAKGRPRCRCHQQTGANKTSSLSRLDCLSEGFEQPGTTKCSNVDCLSGGGHSARL